MTTKDPYDRDVGRRVKLRRLELGLSQTDLADALGLTFQQVQKYEKGANRIGAGRLKRIADILKVPVSFFFDEVIGGSRQRATILGFMDTAYSLRLVQAFSRIKDVRIQRSVVELLEQIADAADK